MSEAAWEHLALEALAELGWRPAVGTAPGTGERESSDDPLIASRLRAALRTLNPGVPPQHLDQALAMSVDPSLAGRDHRGLPWPDPIDDVGQE